MSEPAKALDFAAGQEAPQIPHVPSPGKPKNEKGEDDGKGIPALVRIAGAVIAIVATVAGIIFGIWQLVQSNRTYQKEMLQMQQQIKAQENDAKLAIAKQEGQTQAQKTQQAQYEDEKAKSELTVASEKARAEITAAEARIAEAHSSEAKIQADRARNERERQIQAESDNRHAAMELAKSRSEQFLAIREKVLKLRSANTVDDLMAESTSLTQYLASADPSIRSFVLDVFDVRLQQFPRSKPELVVIFSALPDAGPEAMPVAVRANRMAWKELRPAIEAFLFATEQKNPNQSQEEVVAQVLAVLEPLHRGAHAKLVDEDMKTSIDLLMYLWGPRGPKDKTKQYNLDSSIPALDVVVSMLVQSRQTIERLILRMQSDVTVNLDQCFLPYFAPDGETDLDTISLKDSYIVAADFRNLSSDSTITILAKNVPGVDQRLFVFDYMFERYDRDRSKSLLLEAREAIRASSNIEFDYPDEHRR